MVNNRLVAYKIRVVDIINSNYYKSDEDMVPDYISVNGNNVSRVNLMGFVVGKNIHPNFESISFDDGTATIEVRNFGSVLLANFDVGGCVNVTGRIKEYGNLRYVVCETCKSVDVKWLEFRKKELELDSDDFVSAEALVAKPITERILEEEREKEKFSEEKDEETILEENEIKFGLDSESDETSKLIEESKVEDKVYEEDPDSLLEPEEEGEDSIAEEETVGDEKEESNPVEKILKTIKELDDGDGVDVDDLISKIGDNAESLVTTLLSEGELFEIKPGRVKVLE